MEPYGIGTFIFNPTQRQSFRDGILREQWFEQYPLLFDEHDRRLATNQPMYHFFEWLGAIRIYQDMGWICLVEKYTCKNHPRKLEFFKSIVPTEVFGLITTNSFGRQQWPDIFAYSPDEKDWFLCEVKGLGDRLSQKQGLFFTEVEQVSNKKILSMKFKTHL
ncbi:MAG: hypothetical protein M1511_04955 [Deltaproteobacteria bacterium]|nr:hypothetical protein [Deltaproteobacteria bacterium]